ncbi:MAG: type II toxin-antitoxin system HicA family toxin [Streptosporangiaceae bacterium]
MPGAKVVKALERAGFTLSRVSRSHHVMRHPDGRTVVVPVHAGHDVPRAPCATSW